jgi:hypothetical protein
MKSLRPYTPQEISAIHKNYSMGAVIDNKRLAEVGANYRLTAAGDMRCSGCGGPYTEIIRDGIPQCDDCGFPADSSLTPTT